MNTSQLVMEPEKFRDYTIRAGTKFIFERDPEKAANILEGMIEVYYANSKEESDILECASSVDGIIKRRKQTQYLVNAYINSPSNNFADEIKDTLEFKLKEWKVNAEEQLTRLVDERAAYVIKHNIQPSRSKYFQK